MGVPHPTRETRLRKGWFTGPERDAFNRDLDDLLAELAAAHAKIDEARSYLKRIERAHADAAHLQAIAAEALTALACEGRPEPLVPLAAQVEQMRRAILACVGDAEGQEAVHGRKMLELTKGQVQLLARAVASVGEPAPETTQ